MSSNCQTHFFGANEDKSKRDLLGFPWRSEGKEMDHCQAGRAEGESERSALSCEPAEQGSCFAEPLLFYFYQ